MEMLTVFLAILGLGRVHVKRARRLFAIDQGHGVTMVRWAARRKTRPNVVGYGLSAADAIFDLRENVQPDWTGKPDGKDPYRGGNMFPRKVR